MAVRLTDGSSQARLSLAFDVGALALFVLAGMRSHHEGSQLTIFLRNFVPVTGAWLLLVPFFGTYRPPAWRTLLLTWVVAVPAGLVVRSALLGDLFDADILTFFAVALAFTLLFLVVGRLLSGLLGRALTGRAA